MARVVDEPEEDQPEEDQPEEDESEEELETRSANISFDYGVTRNILFRIRLYRSCPNGSRICIKMKSRIRTR